MPASRASRVTVVLSMGFLWWLDVGLWRAVELDGEGENLGMNLLPALCETIVPHVTSQDLRQKLDKLDAAILAEHQVDMPITNYFARGVYAREAFIPKGTVVTGRVHKYSQINILLKGSISILTEKGMELLSAPFTIVSPPGTKRAAYAHEDVIWTTICGTEHTDLETMEDYLACRTFEEYEDFCQQQKELICQSS